MAVLKGATKRPFEWKQCTTVAFKRSVNKLNDCLGERYYAIERKNENEVALPCLCHNS